MSNKPSAPIGGVPIQADPDEDFTPIAEVLDRVEFVPTDRERILLHMVWQHTANMELRARSRRDTGDVKALEDRLDLEVNALDDRIDGHDAAIIDIRGEHGNNGKLGALRSKVDGALSKAWLLVTILIGGVAGAAVKLVIVGRAYGELETKVENTASRVQLLERATYLKFFPGLGSDMPAPPEKEPQP